jgi:hypothetical protein
MRWWACCVVLSLGIWGISVSGAPGQGQCEAERSAWLAAGAMLKEGMASYQEVKQESISAKIESALEEHKTTAPFAQIVQHVLKERADRMDVTKAKCRDLEETERRAFEDWRRCAAAGTRRGNTPDPRLTEPMLRERSQLLAQLQDVFLEEGHVQYKNSRDPVPSSYSSYGSSPGYQQPWGPYQQGLAGYPYQGYYR